MSSRTVLSANRFGIDAHGCHLNHSAPNDTRKSRSFPRGGSELIPFPMNRRDRPRKPRKIEAGEENRNEDEQYPRVRGPILLRPRFVT